MKVENMNQTHTLTVLPCTSDDAFFVELRLSFPSQIHAISRFVDQLMSFITKSRNKDGSETYIEMALIEALENAVVHGNCHDPHKRVYVTCRCTAEGEVSITVRDEGQGFNTVLCPIQPLRKIGCALPGAGST